MDIVKSRCEINLNRLAMKHCEDRQVIIRVDKLIISDDFSHSELTFFLEDYRFIQTNRVNLHLSSGEDLHAVVLLVGKRVVEVSVFDVAPVFVIESVVVIKNVNPEKQIIKLTTQNYVALIKNGNDRSISNY